jgi:predicted CoA-substrate-specific enzyme activase
MRFAGIDIGSRSIELVVVDETGAAVHLLTADTGFAPMEQVEKMLKQVQFDAITATGYGRTLMEISFDIQTVTEIKAHATAVHSLFPHIEAIIDIGGQDSKAIALNAHGRVKKFEMNDRCAAGTGKFLEVMAKNLGYSIEEFGANALAARESLIISNMCTVFAESEVTSLIAKGKDRKTIARGLHESVAKRTAAMLRHISDQTEVAFTGGVAQNDCLVALLGEKLEATITVPENPHSMGALGAALITLRQAQTAV